ncbi:MAG: glycosyltransferase [Pseudomonadota bacterium]
MSHRNAIILFCDGTYIPFAAWTAGGLVANGALETCDVIVLSPDEAGLDLVREHCPGVLAEHIAADFAPFGFTDVPDDFPTRSFLNLFAPHYFEARYDRLILCDVDYEITSPDMPRLFELEMKTYPLAAMRDIIGLHPTYAEANHKRYYAPADLPITTPYLNGGFQVIDVKPYLGERVAERALASTLERGGPKYLGDQRALNAVLRGDWMELSPNCNWAAVWPNQNPAHGAYAKRVLRPCGVHLLGAAKPWRTNRPGRIDPDLSQRMTEWFAASPWPAEIPEQDLSRNAALIAKVEAEAPPISQVFAPEVLRYMKRDFEDISQGLAPSFDPQGLLADTGAETG